LLVYAVCTLTHDENEGVVDAFRRAHPRFALEDAAREGGAPAALVTTGGCLRTLPHRDGLDGFFAARLRARS
jgi:16S rRNA (cytosine967-C5)-methyltransferase